MSRNYLINQGTFYTDRIPAWNGNTIVYAYAGNDIIYDGNLSTDLDMYFGQSGDDFIFNHAGEDRIWGGAGDDTVHSDSLDNIYFNGNKGNDQLNFYLPDCWTVKFVELNEHQTVVSLYNENGFLMQEIATCNVEVFQAYTA
jgi:Ca2+-binding RTX toxin-like protein